jgi:hypothetical protein
VEGRGHAIEEDKEGHDVGMRAVVGVAGGLLVVLAVGQKRDGWFVMMPPPQAALHASFLIAPSLLPSSIAYNRQRQSIAMADAASPEPGRDNGSSRGMWSVGGRFQEPF